MKGTPIDKALCEYLKKYRRGQESAASSKELEAAFHVKGTELRRAVNRLRCDGPFAAMPPATSTRHGSRRYRPPSPSSPGVSPKSPPPQKGC